MRKGLDVLTYEEFTAPGMPGEKLGLDYRPEGGGTSIEVSVGLSCWPREVCGGGTLQSEGANRSLVVY